MLTFIAWTCIVLSVLVLAASVSSYAAMRLQHKLPAAKIRENIAREAPLLLVWIGMLLCGIGLRLGQNWGRVGIQVAAIAVVAWMGFLAWHRLKVAKMMDEDVPGVWRSSLIGHTIVLVALGAVAAALVGYLHTSGVRDAMQ